MLDNANPIILYYDVNVTKPSQLEPLVKQLRDSTDKLVIALPKQYDIMLDCSIDQLYSIRAVIDTAIKLKADKEDGTTLTGKYYC